MGDRQGFGRHAMIGLLAATALGGVPWAGARAAPGDAPDSVVAPKPGAIQPSAPPNQLADFSNLVAQVKPAVVSITTRIKSDRPEPVAGMLPFPGMMPRGPQHSVEARGSGFIIDPNGTVVTNNHVIHDADRITVTLDDGTELPATLVGTDARTDIAVLRVKAAHKLPFINLGDSDQVRPGNWVLAVGNPFGLGGSVTAGIVSARGRDIGEGPYDSFIQVDAPINQGNSGGPLFTQDGKVVGVNTAILSPSGGSVGIGFAIPSDTVKTVVAQLERSGKVTRGYLGVKAQLITPAMAGALNLPPDPATRGALVASVQPNSPAQQAGLQPGDVILQVDGKPIGSPRDLAMQVSGFEPGHPVQLAVLRDGKAQPVKATLADLPDNPEAGAAPEAGGTQTGGIGLALVPLTPDLRNELDVPARQQGVVIAEVQPDSLAALAGLRQGDLIVAVGNKPVTTPTEAAEAIRNAHHDGHPVALRVVRDGQSVFVAITGAG